AATPPCAQIAPMPAEVRPGHRVACLLHSDAGTPVSAAAPDCPRLALPTARRFERRSRRARPRPRRPTGTTHENHPPPPRARGTDRLLARRIARRVQRGEG